MVMDMSISEIIVAVGAIIGLIREIVELYKTIKKSRNNNID